MLDALDDDALDALPFGAIALTADGRVDRYNQVEARRANLARWQVLGRNFLRELAWSLGSAADLRIRTFLAGGASTSFKSRARTRSGVREVDVTVRRRVGGGAWILVEDATARAATAPLQRARV